jgi:hypothetical protein
MLIYFSFGLKGNATKFSKKPEAEAVGLREQRLIESIEL